MLLLAPMQEVSTLALWRTMARHGGGPDVFVTEYFRVHANARPDARILRSVTDDSLGKPVIAQMIGNNPKQIAEMAKCLEDAGAAGIDLNLGCPAPVVCGKKAGGALLRDPALVREIVETLRPVVRGTLSLKTRVGFESPEEFPVLLDLFADLPIDALAIHGRTVKERYQSEVHVEEIAAAVDRLDCPVYANGSVVSVASAEGMLRKTGAAGLMVGRGAIRNPWLFSQIRSSGTGSARPGLRDLHAYVAMLYEEVAASGPSRASRSLCEAAHVHRMKKFMNYIASGIGEGRFQHEIRRASTGAEFWKICDRFLLTDAPLPGEPTADGRLFCGFESLAG